MPDTTKSLEDAFEEFETDGVYENRDTYRIVFRKRPDKEKVEEIISETLAGKVAGLSLTQESRESEEGMVTVAEFRYRN